MDKQKALKKIAGEIARCIVCKKDSIGVAVPGEGNPNAKIVFVGEAPGKTEARTGYPFIGRSGTFLRSQIQKILNLDDRKDVYITSPIKYLPKKGTPTPSQIAHGRKHFLKQLEIINPEIIVIMGRVAALGVLNEAIATSKLHGTYRKEKDKIYFFSYHPAAAVRFHRHTFIEDFKKLKKLIQ